MRIRGIDFTSAPGRRKPITCLECRLEGEALVVERLSLFPDFASFEAALREPGPWVAGFDFPFGLPRRFLTDQGWDGSWAASVQAASQLSPPDYRARLQAWKATQPAGRKHPARVCERVGGRSYGAASALMIDYTPVGMMFRQGAFRLLDSGVTIPGLQPGDPQRLCFEAYPGLAALRLRGVSGARGPSYKSDIPKKQSPLHLEERHRILAALRGAPGREIYGLTVEAPDDLATDPSADALDALLAAVQAAWAYRQFQGTAPDGVDPLEGWIADPAARP